MEILREYATIEFDREDPKRFPKEYQSCQELYFYSAVEVPNQPVLKPTYTRLDEEGLFDRLEENGTTRTWLGPPHTASLHLVFLPVDAKGGGFCLSKSRLRTLCKHLNLDDTLLGFLVSSRSGWYHVDSGNGCHSFFYKDYLYSMAWSFNAKTIETRAVIIERSEWKEKSFLRKERQEKWTQGKGNQERRHQEEGNQGKENKNVPPKPQDFCLPGLEPQHLYHPLTLAFFGLVDATCYLDRVIVTDGYSLGDIEKLTKHGVRAIHEEKLKAQTWHVHGHASHAENGAQGAQQQQECRRNVSEKKIQGNKAGQLVDAEESKKKVEKFSEASRKIATVIGVFSTLFKSVGVAKSITETLENNNYWKEWTEKAVMEGGHRQEYQEHVLDQFTLVAKSMQGAVQLLRARIHTVNESALSTQKRAKAQANVISGLIAREDTRIGHVLADRARRDGSTMKVIALMTMAFLPATFFAALWSIPVLEDPGLTKDNFWVYWAFTVPTTIVIFFVWDWLNDKNLWELTKLNTYYAVYHAFARKFKKDRKTNDTHTSEGVKEPVVVNPADASSEMLGRFTQPRETDLEKGGPVDRSAAPSPFPRNPSPPS
ncbi:hypothetical protein PG984_016291 [Apiospora sp. TS-2023a]